MNIWQKIINIFGVLYIGKLIFSYLDPGSGSLLIQILLATLLSLTFFFGMFWRKVKKLLGFASRDTADDITEDTEVGNSPGDRNSEFGS